MTDRIALFVLACVLTMGMAMPAGAQDLEVYVGLSRDADAAFAALDDDATDTRREQAVEAADAVIAWLRAFRLSDAYGVMAQEEQRAVLMDLHRWEYNAARQRIALGRCDEARDRLGPVLEAGVVDEALLPRLGAAYAEAVSCSTPAFGVLEVTADPPDAEVWIDDVRVGTAGEPLRVAVGEHRVELRAPGYRATVLSFAVAGDGDRVALGPVALALEPVAAAVAAPMDRRPARRALFVSGGGLVALGAGALVAAETYRGRVDDPPEGTTVADPEREDGIVRRRRALGATSIGAGLALTVTAAVLGGRRDDAEQRAVHFTGDGVRVDLGGARR